MILTILQARMSSSRLPGKVLLPILGEAMLQRQLERISPARKIDHLIVATSVGREDDAVAAFCFEKRVDCFRGDLENVLDRFYQAAKNYDAQTIVRLTGDCPLADSAIIDRAITIFESGKYDYVSNTVERTYPVGLDVEVFSVEALEEAWREAVLPSEKEHVTRFIYTHPEDFRIGQFKSERNLSDLRWTVDEPADYEFVMKIYERLYPADHNFTTEDVLNLLQKEPQLKAINAGVDPGRGLNKSLEQDAQFMKAIEEE
jgi:spore coat polysaccharide biosynthesis protein SpsF